MPITRVRLVSLLLILTIARPAHANILCFALAEGMRVSSMDTEQVLNADALGAELRQLRSRITDEVPPPGYFKNFSGNNTEKRKQLRKLLMHLRGIEKFTEAASGDSEVRNRISAVKLRGEEAILEFQNRVNQVGEEAFSFSDLSTKTSFQRAAALKFNGLTLTAILGGLVNFFIFRSADFEVSKAALTALGSVILALSVTDNLGDIRGSFYCFLRDFWMGFGKVADFSQALEQLKKVPDLGFTVLSREHLLVNNSLNLFLDAPLMNNPPMAGFVASQATYQQNLRKHVSDPGTYPIMRRTAALGVFVFDRILYRDESGVPNLILVIRNQKESPKFPVKDAMLEDEVVRGVQPVLIPGRK